MENRHLQQSVGGKSEQNITKHLIFSHACVLIVCHSLPLLFLLFPLLLLPLFCSAPSCFILIFVLSLYWSSPFLTILLTVHFLPPFFSSFLHFGFNFILPFPCCVFVSCPFLQPSIKKIKRPTSHQTFVVGRLTANKHGLLCLLCLLAVRGVPPFRASST